MCRACTFLLTTARASSEHSVRVQAVEVEHTEGSLVALSQTVPFGMEGLRRSVQTCPFPRRTLDHGRRTLHDDSFYGRERHGKVASLMENITSRLLLWLSTSIKCQSRAPTSAHSKAASSSTEFTATALYCRLHFF